MVYCGKNTGLRIIHHHRKHAHIFFKNGVDFMDYTWSTFNENILFV